MFKHEKLNLLIFIVLVALQVLGVIGLLTRFHLFYLAIMLPSNAEKISPFIFIPSFRPNVTEFPDAGRSYP